MNAQAQQVQNQTRLTDEQMAAITATGPRSLVIAPAGSGKTTVLIRRILYVLNHASPETVAVLTFTRAAASELKQRLAQYVPVATVKRMFTGTFHSFAVHALRRFPPPSRTTDFVIWDDTQKKDVIAMYAREMGRPKKDPAVHAAYENAAAASDAMDYDMLEEALLHLLQRDDRGTRWLRGRSRVVLVDEFQDTTQRQQRIVELLQPDDLFVVGDPRQSIYGWRGARPDVFTDYMHSSQWKTHRLTVNHRSVPRVVESANRVISAWMPDFADMRSFRDSDGLVETKYEPDPVLKWLAGQKGAKAVLVRTNRQAAGVSGRLNAQGLDHVVWGNKSSMWDTPCPRLLLRALSAIFQRHDWVDALLSAKIWADLDDRGLRLLRMRALEQGRDLGDVLAIPFTAYMPDALDVIIPRLQAVCGAAATDAITAAEQWTEQTQRFGIRPLIRDFLLRVTDRSSQDEAENPDPDKINVMTVHASKGLEFDNVVVWNARDTFADHEDVRVGYVAVTRAAKQLVFVPGTYGRGIFAGGAL